MWQVVERVAVNELGGAVNVARFRTLARAGSTILQWLADNAAALNQPAAATTDLPNPDTGLINAVEQWLACSGIHDATITQAAVTPAAMTTGVATVTGATVDLLAIAHELMRIIGLRAAPGSDDPVRTTDDPVRRWGPIALFCGNASSGKTLGAHALATARSRDLVRVDLKQAVSKYIGETEKNLDAALSRAERLGALLLLDEADALFGRRTDVRDSHDRYANLQVQALLRRLRTYPGVVIVESKVTPASSDQDWTTGQTRVVSFPLAPPAPVVGGRDADPTRN